MFWCYPPHARCEWQNLRTFVARYNELNGSAYQRDACLDVSNRSRKEPEILLKDDAGHGMVIERKCVCWPEDYIRWHNKEHLFSDCIHARLAGCTRDGVYLLCVRAKDLHGRDQDVRRIADAVADRVIADIEQAKGTAGVRSGRPVPWSFSPLPEAWRDEDDPPVGLGVQVEDDWTSFDAYAFGCTRRLAQSELTDEVARHLQASRAKFAHYGECRKVVLLEFYGKASDFLAEEEVGQLVRSQGLPEIDEIWMGRPEHLSNTEWRVIYNRVR